MKPRSLLLPFMVGVLAITGTTAFSRGSRREILIRDHYCCFDCGRHMRDGWRLDAAHYIHDRHRPFYNVPENGRALCLLDHLKSTVIDDGDLYAAQLIVSRAWERGLHHDEWYKVDPELLIDDRISLVMAIEQLGIGSYVHTPG